MLYFSYDHDITNSTQRFMTLTKSIEYGVFPLHHFANDNYWWNKHMCQPFVDENCHDFVIPLICGFVGHLPVVLPTISPQHVNQSSDPGIGQSTSSPTSEVRTIETEVDILLVSRMHRHRVGTRYTRRGLDVHGYCANFVETELLVMTEFKIASYVQLRGSVPWLWRQKTDLSYKPPIDVEVGNPFMHSASHVSSL